MKMLCILLTKQMVANYSLYMYGFKFSGKMSEKMYVGSEKSRIKVN